MKSQTKAPALVKSFISCKCPRCRKGNIFTHSIVGIKFHRTNDYCPNCQLKFEHETGFFWGAMYISYAFSTIIMIAFGVTAISFDVEFKTIFMILVPFVLLITPILYRYSRVLLLYTMSPNKKYDPKY